jgi:hypothetical protein
MEPDVRYFLLCIVQSISMVLLWMLVNMTLGIYFDFAFFENPPTVFNYLYGLFLIASFILLIRYLQKKWKGWKEPGE